jgi:hypothetical protein
MRRVKFNWLEGYIGFMLQVRAFGDAWTIRVGIFNYEFCLLRVKLFSCDIYGQMTELFEFSFLWFSALLHAGPVFEEAWKEKS